jgi:hypothetical protein
MRVVAWSAVASDEGVRLLAGGNVANSTIELFAADGRMIAAWERTLLPRSKCLHLPLDDRTARGAFCLRIPTSCGSQVIRIAH